MDKKAHLLEILNEILALEPIKYGIFNVRMTFDQPARLRELERRYPEIGLVSIGDPRGNGISTLSLIATITDALVGDRLAFIVDDETGFITGACWHYDCEKGKETDG